MFFLVSLICAECNLAFDLCSRCYRNQKCCSDSCRESRSLFLHRIANALHSETAEGRELNRERQQRWRDRVSSMAKRKEVALSSDAPRNGCNSLSEDSSFSEALACSIGISKEKTRETRTFGVDLVTPVFSDGLKLGWCLVCRSAGWMRGSPVSA